MRHPHLKQILCRLPIDDEHLWKRISHPPPQTQNFDPQWNTFKTLALRYFAVLGFVLSGLYVLALLATLFFVLKSSAVVGMYLNFLPSGVIL